MVRWLLISCCLFMVFGCSSETPPEESQSITEDLRAKDYVLAETFFEDGGLDAWYDLARKLKSNFDDVCGDTFCEGEYTNYESLAFRCSVSKKEGTVGSCVWVFAASEESVTASTGNVRVDAASLKCRIPIAPKTLASDFVAALAQAPKPIEAKLPGSEKSVYDALVDCF